MVIPKFMPGQKTPSILTYKNMRRVVGILGISLPVVILVWSFTFSSCHYLLDSISTYYHTDIRDIFVGILCAVSFFMFSYHGYDMIDFITFKITSLSCLGVAMCPVFMPDGTHVCFNPTPNQSTVTGIIHFTCAAIFFCLLAIIPLFLFTKTHKGADKSELPMAKIRRNRFYIACGIIIMACVVLLALYNLLPKNSFIEGFNPVFWLETIALLSFGLSWLVKGKVGYFGKDDVDDD